MQPNPLGDFWWPCKVSAEDETRLAEFLKDQIGPIIMFE